MKDLSTCPVQLKNVKIAASLSDETTAFTASIYLDKVKIGTAYNHGQGGNTNVHVAKDHLDRFKAICAEYHDPKGPYTVNEWNFGEELIDNLLYEYMVQIEKQKEIKRWTKTQVVFRIPGDAPDSFRTIKHNGKILEAKQWIARKYPEIIEIYP